MKIELKQFTVKDVFEGYVNKEDEGEFALGGKLTIRPSYQREFVYDSKQEKAVMETVLNNFPLNSMYWILKEDGNYEVLDGQQRILSIMHYLNHNYTIKTASGDCYWDSLPDDQLEIIKNYPLQVYVCSEGTASEKLAWFKTINIAGEKLTDQELRNASYTGSWLSEAKKKFSKRNCSAYNMGNKFIKGDPNRQELLETALKWIANKENKTIEEYMSEHQHDANADELWNYFQNVINWVKDTFPEGCREEKFMKGLPWGEYYNKYSEYTYDPEKVEKEVNELMADEDVTNRKGIYLYVLSKDYDSTAERHLNIRAFEDKDKKRKYEEQGHKCAKCGKEFKFEEMQGDHIIPWSLGGHTEYSNLQMLCQKCNASKSNK